LRKYIIKKYINKYTSTRFDSINKEFDEDNIEEYINVQIKLLRKYFDISDKHLCELILSRIPPKIADLFYIYGMYKSTNDLLIHAKVLDSYNPQISNDSNSNSNANLESANSNVINQSIIHLARNELTSPSDQQPRQKSFLDLNYPQLIQSETCNSELSNSSSSYSEDKTDESMANENHFDNLHPIDKVVVNNSSETTNSNRQGVMTRKRTRDATVSKNVLNKKAKL
jgi:hypothetical protein